MRALGRDLSGSMSVCSISISVNLIKALKASSLLPADEPRKESAAWSLVSTRSAIRSTAERVDSLSIDLSSKEILHCDTAIAKKYGSISPGLVNVADLSSRYLGRRPPLCPHLRRIAIVFAIRASADPGLFVAQLVYQGHDQFMDGAR